MIKKISFALIFLVLLTVFLSWPTKTHKTLLPFSPGDKWGYVNEHYNLAIPEQFDEADEFHESRAVVKKDGQYGFIDPQGKAIIYFPLGDDVYNFSGGLAAVHYKGKWGFVDYQGITRIPYQFDQVDDFCEGLASVEKDNKWGFINTRGETTVLPQFEDELSFSGNLAAAQLKGKWGYIDPVGKTVLPFQFQEAGAFEEGLAGAKAGGKWGFIGKDGRWVIPPAFQKAHYFSQGLAAVSDGRGWAYIDPTGKKLIPGPFEEADAFSEGLASVRKGHQWGYIDRTGKWVIPPQFMVAGSFTEGWARVFKDNRIYYIDPAGRAIWDAPLLTPGPGLWIYLFGLLLPGLAAYGYCRRGEKTLLGLEGDAARDGYYRLGLKLNRLYLAYIFWFFAGLTLTGETGDWYSVCGWFWNWVKASGPQGAWGGSFFYCFLFLSSAALYLAGAVFLKSAYYRIDRLLRKTSWTRVHYLWLVVRMQLVFLLPMFLWFILTPFLPKGDLGYLACIFLFILLFSAFSPLVVRFIWRTRPLDSPELSQKVQQLCAKAGIQVRGVGVLETSSGRVANAMVAGVFPFYRYIFFTDHLLAHFTPEELETVLAHEIGHVKKGHLWRNLALFALWISASHFIYRAAAPVFSAMGISMVFFYLAWAFLFLGVVLKFFSRGFEREADRYCVELTGKREVFISALSKLTEMNFSTRKWVGLDRFLKTHPDLEGRIQNLKEMAVPHPGPSTSQNP